jgi:hypothetical protein
VLQRVIADLGSGADDVEAWIMPNELRRQILVRNWREELAQPTSERLVAILQQWASDKGYSSRLRLAVELAIAKPECLTPKTAPQLWSLVQTLYQRVTKIEDKNAVYQGVLTFAAYSPDAQTSQNSKAFVEQTWRTLTDPQLRLALEFLSTHPNAASLELQKLILKQELTTANNEIQNPSARTMDRVALCHEYGKLLSADAVEGLLLKAVATQDAPFTNWSPAIAEYSVKLSGDFPRQVCEQCLSLAAGPQTSARKLGLAGLFVAVLPALPSQQRSPLLQNYFGLCKNPDESVRRGAVSVLPRVAEGVDMVDFRLGLNSLVRDLCDLKPAEISAYQQVLDAIMNYADLLDEHAWSDVAALSKRLMQETNQSLKNYGVQLVSRMPKLPKEHETDLVHLLVTAARTSSNADKENALEALRRMNGDALGTEARIEADAFLHERGKE